MRAGYRKEVDDRKEDSLDFALWKSAKPGEPSWDSPWGPGRPGWHIECSAMNHHLFGDSIDIHGGGNDLIFPHHENEIAQSECFTGKPFARYWIHNGMLRLGNEKMSKSIGNVISIQDFLKKHSANSFRYLILNSAYRNPILFDEDTLGQAEKAVDRMKSCLKPANPKTEITDQAVIDAFNAKIAAVKEGFIEDMDDDFNSAGALGKIFELVREINSMRDAGASQAQLDPAQNQIREFADVFGLVLDDGKSDAAQSADPFIQMLVDLRFELKKQKNWALADQIRNQLTEQGITIEDSKEGSLWYRK
jgi:cysteinyl-tRNA synthetase